MVVNWNGVNCLWTKFKHSIETKNPVVKARPYTQVSTASVAYCMISARLAHKNAKNGEFWLIETDEPTDWPTKLLSHKKKWTLILVLHLAEQLVGSFCVQEWDKWLNRIFNGQKRASPNRWRDHLVSTANSLVGKFQFHRMRLLNIKGKRLHRQSRPTLS